MRRTLALAAAAVLVTAGCSSSGGASGASASASGSASPVGTPVPPATLADTVAHGLSGVRSVHVALDITIAGKQATITGDETLSGGTPQRLRASSTDIDGSGPVGLIVVGGRDYAKLPTSINHTGRPYVLLDPKSSSAAVRQAADTVATVRGAVSLDNAAGLLRAAASARRTGTVAGATRYRITVPVASLPASFPGRQLLTGIGLKTIDADLDLDAHDRPVRVATAVDVAGQHSRLTITLGRYDAPVTITAPPAAQVGRL